MTHADDRAFTDERMTELLAIEEHVVSLLGDVRVRDELISQLLTTLHSQNELVARLTWRLKQAQEPRRG